MNLNCPNCKNTFEVLRPKSGTQLTCPSCNSQIDLDDLFSLNFELSRTRAADPDLPPAEVDEMIDHFRLDKVLGNGGFGTVYEAYDTRLERRVALKLPRHAMSRWQVEIFVHEAKSAAQLQNPNIVSVHDIGGDQGRAYIVSELIDGLTLDQWRRSEQPDAKQSAGMIAKIARALHTAHASGIVHRDVKPHNIIVDFENEPHVTDFGLAKRESKDARSITKPGQVIGTYAYMPPEQALGKADEADGRADIFSLGVVLYEMLLGERPFRGESDVITEEIIRCEAPSPHEVNKSVHADISAICMKAMARLPGHRFRSALEFAEDLERFVEERETITNPFTLGGKLKRGFRQQSSKILLFVLLVGLVAAVSFIWATSGNKKEKTVFNDPSRDVENSSGEAQELSEKRFVVRFEVATDLTDLETRLVRIAPELGRIEYEKIRTASVSNQSAESTTFEIDLEPGWYQVEVTHGDEVVHDVCRLVPESLTEPFGMYRSTDWTEIDANTIRWKSIVPVELVSDDNGGFKLGPETLVVVPSAEFEVGAEKLFHVTLPVPTPIRPTRMLQINSFYCGQHEVSLEHFVEVVGREPLSMPIEIGGSRVQPRFVAFKLSYLEAMEYCELIGARLPFFEEYLFVATNGGKSRYPWGEKWTRTKWELGSVDQYGEDVNEWGIVNLYSNVLEWTQDFAIPLHQRSGGFDWKPMDQLGQMKNSRFIVGGPQSMLRRMGIDPFEDTSGPRKPIIGIFDQNYVGLGVRVYRSSRPRLRIGSANELLDYYLDVAEPR